MIDFFTAKPRPGDLLRVKITDATTAKAWDSKEPRSVMPGEEVDVTSNDAAWLVDAGRATVIATLTADGIAKELTKRLPLVLAGKRFEYPPMPDEFSSLPSCFAAAWKSDERYAKLKYDIGAAQQAASAPSVRSVDDAYIEAEKRLRIARDRIADFDWEDRAKTFRACGKHVADATDAANELRDEAARIGFEIFALRLQVLELADMKLRFLFDGSGLKRKYIRPSLTLAGRCGDGSSEGAFIEGPVECLAGELLEARKRVAEMQKLVDAAKAEFAAAASVVAAPTIRKGVK